MVERANLLIGAARDLEPTNADADGAPAIDFSQTAKEIIARIRLLTNIHDEKLGMLTESSIRRGCDARTAGVALLSPNMTLTDGATGPLLSHNLRILFHMTRAW